MHLNSSISALSFFVAIVFSACTYSTSPKSSALPDSGKVLEPITAEQIDRTPDSNLVFMVYEHIAQGLPEDPNQELAYILSLPKPRQAVYVIGLLEAEVSNGGFNQFYYNPSGKFAELARNALKSVGAHQFAALTAAANKVYKNNMEHITKHQDGTIEGFSKSYEDNPLEKFDDQYYQLKEPLGQLQIEFIRKNKQAFIIP